jgi:hypothetical protein
VNFGFSTGLSFSVGFLAGCPLVFVLRAAGQLGTAALICGILIFRKKPGILNFGIIFGIEGILILGIRGIPGSRKPGMGMPKLELGKPGLHGIVGVPGTLGALGTLGVAILIFRNCKCIRLYRSSTIMVN